MHKIIYIALVILIAYIQPGKSPITEHNSFEAINLKILKDSIYAKNLDALSRFSDTTKLKRFHTDIAVFNIIDSIKANQKVDIVFTGSSSIRKWKTLENDLPACKVLNRGFGGSTIPEVIYFSDELIFRHCPSKIVLYAGENDISAPKSNEKKVYDSFVYLHQLVKHKLPGSHLYFISIKPSPSRWHLWPKMKIINEKVKVYCDSTENCTYIDASSQMLNPKGVVRTDIFLKDKLHFNKAGYEIWKTAIALALECEINKGLQIKGLKLIDEKYNN